MVQVGDVIVSFDVLREKFSCDLDACRGACCIEGDAGAPVTLDEIAEIESLLPDIEDDLTPEARAIIARQGVAYTDPTGDLVTSIVGGKDCVFGMKKGGMTLCAIEKAWREGSTSFQKPVSCHLYPIRVSHFGQYYALNYNRWDICKAAVIKGEKDGIPVYRFLREPLIRRFGQAWYDELELVVSELSKQHLL
jgi:Protein of unknown function (DUF3109).